MKDNRKSEIKVGVTVFVSILALLYVIGWVKDFSLVDNRQEYRVVFNTVAGLSEGDGVTIRGVRKGLIESITLNGDGAVATLLVESDIELYSDATFSVMMLDLMGGKKIEVDPGTSGVPIDANVLHQGRFLGDISVAMASLSSVQDDLVEVIKQIKTALNQLNNNYLDDEFSDKLNNALTGFQELTDNMNRVITKNDEAVTQLINSGNLAAEKTIKLLNDNEKVINSTLTNLNDLIVHSDSLVRKMDDFSNEVKSQDNNIGKIIYDEKLYDDLVSVVGQLRELTQLIIQQLKNEGVKVDADVF